jgi:serine/threonine-protein kinase
MATWNPRANAVFASLLELPPPQRQAALEQACGADGELRRQVEALLAAHAQAGSFLDRPDAGAAPPEALDLPPTGPDSGPPLDVNGSVVRALGAASAVHLRDPEGEAPTPVVRPFSDNLPAVHNPSGHLSLYGEIARGGMGAILKGRDLDLGRDLAVKVLLETHQGKTELVQRFVEEAQIAGQLQHPGITPVYELGAFADRRPYFTMKLVKGQTLAAMLAKRKQPAEERSKYVGIFAQVCQTLAYAHARGVIHRDLKPSNVMVGSFGEVQVMDWGLAKVLRQGGVADEEKAQQHQATSIIRTQRSPGSSAPAGVGSHTQAGSVLGTPAYMAPEQARGDVELIDERADVFGLGGILCEVLTGQPPYAGKKGEVQRKAQTASLDDACARLDGCGADAELIGLAKRCLAAEPWDRPRDAGQVAEAVAAYQNSVAERLRQAELAHAAEVARTEEAQATAAQERKAREAAQARAVAERRARRLTLALAASVLALVVVGVAGGLRLQQQEAERTVEAARQRAAVETALEKTRELRQQGRWPEARVILDQTRLRLGKAGPEELRQRVEQAKKDLALVDRLEAIRQRLLIAVEGKLDYRTAEQDYAAAFRDAGLGEVWEDTETVAARLRDSAVREQLVAAFDHWAAVTNDPKREAWLLEVARAADRGDPWRERFRDPKVWRDRGGLEALAKELLADEKQLTRQKPRLLAALGFVLLLTQADAVPLLAAAQARHPDDFWLNFYLGNALFGAKKRHEAVGFYRGAVAVRPSVAMVHNNLGTALQANQQLDEAIKEFRRAIDLDPKSALPHSNLGNALRGKNQLDEAIKEVRKAVDLDPKFALLHYNLGAILFDKNQLDEAIEAFRKAIDLDPKYASPHYGLGQTLLQLGRFAEARESTRRCLALLQRDNPLRQLAAEGLKDCEQLLAKDRKLVAILEGKERPANDAERLVLAEFCQDPPKKLYAASSRFYAEAFANDAKLADDMQEQHRYLAACAAALACCGQGKDAAKLDAKERAHLRRQAVAWLRADLAHWARQAERNKPGDRALVRKTLQHWQDHGDLAGIRDRDAVAKMPAEERAACQKLWAEVADLMKKTQEKTK